MAHNFLEGTETLRGMPPKMARQYILVMEAMEQDYRLRWGVTKRLQDTCACSHSTVCAIASVIHLVSLLRKGDQETIEKTRIKNSQKDYVSGKALRIYNSLCKEGKGVHERGEMSVEQIPALIFQNETLLHKIAELEQKVADQARYINTLDARLRVKESATFRRQKRRVGR